MAIRQCFRRRRGVALIWAAIMSLVLIGFVGLAMDVSIMVLSGNQLQDTADAAALAGALLVRDTVDGARTLAVTTALANNVLKTPVQLDRNDANAAEGDIVVGYYDRRSQLFDPERAPLNAVRVAARRTDGSLNGSLPLAFGPVLGVNSVNVARDAIAMVGGGTGAGLITLNKYEPCSLSISGNVTLNVSDISDPANPQPGTIQVNSGHTQAACVNGNPDVISAEININGGTDGGFARAGYEGYLNEYCNCTIEDPLAGIPAPTLFGPTQPPVSISGNTKETVDLLPGYYPGGIAMNNNNASIRCAPGLYVVDGVGLDIRGGNFLAEGVMFYVIDSTPGSNPKSHVYLGGNGTIVMSGIDPQRYVYPPEVTIYEGITIFQARTSDHGGIYGNTNEATIIGTSTMDLDGTFYFPENHLKLSGTADSVGNQLIVDSLTVSGNGVININYDGRNPAPGGRVFLVH